MSNSRNFGLLSFGEEAEEDETETNDFVQKNASKSKSVHDVIDDPKLSKEALQVEKQKLADDHVKEKQIESDDDATKAQKTDRIRDKLKNAPKSSKGEKRPAEPEEHQSDSDSDEFTNELERERKLKRQKKA